MRSVSRLGFHYAAFLVVFTALTSAGCATREAGGSRAGSDGPSGTLDSTIIDPASSGNTPPIADAGMDRIASPGDRVELDGSGSFDPDVNDTLTFMWNQTAGDFVELADSDSGQPSFLMPDVEDGVMLSFELTVSDGVSIATDVAEVHASAGGICGFTVRLEDDPEMDPPLDGPRDLNVLVSAAISEDALAEGATLIWTIDGTTERELVTDHLGLRRTFSTVGAHTILLTLLVGDLSTGCVSSGSLTTSEKVTVWPMISGTVRDSEGAAIVEATVAANAGGTTAVTDASGSYVVHVPLGWSGTLTAQHAQYDISPSVYQFADLTVDKQRQFQEGDDPPQTACTNDGECDDGLFCNGSESCIDGACEGGYDPCPGESCDEDRDECFIGAQGLDCQTDLDCDDGLDCTDDACVSGTCSSLPNDANCDDGLFCNGAERCLGGSCLAGTSPCGSDETCDESADECVATPPPPPADDCSLDADCDDGNICNGGETCGPGGLCQPSAPLSCDDGDACTDDSCDPTAGCTYVPKICDDNNACTDDTCDPSTGCQFTSDDTNTCDDSNECTENDACSGGDCSGDPIEGCETGTRYFVDNPGDGIGLDGDDSNPGTEALPFATIQKAANVTSPGDVVLVKAGTYNEMVAITTSGTSDTPIIYQAFPGDIPVIDGENTRRYCFRVGRDNVIDEGHVVIRGFELRKATGVGIHLEEINNVTINNCFIHDNAGDGVNIRGGNDCVIEDNEVFRNRVGIRARWRDTNTNRPLRTIVRRNIVHDNLDAGNQGEDADGIEFFFADDGIIEYNIVFANRDDGIDVSGHGAGGSDRNTIRYNLVFSNGFPVTSGGDGNGLKWSTNNGGGNVIHHNIAFRNRRAGYDQDLEADNAANALYNNVAYNNGLAPNITRAGFVLEGSQTEEGRATVLNNIGINNDQGFVDGRGDFFTHHKGVGTSDFNCWGIAPVYRNPGPPPLDGEEGANTIVLERDFDPIPAIFAAPDGAIDLDTSALPTVPEKWQFLWDQVIVNFSLQPADNPCLGTGTQIPGITEGDSPNRGAVPIPDPPPPSP